MKPDDEIKRKLSEMFNDFESEPKPESWDKIRASIQLSQMFQNFEADPQDDSWEKVRAGVDLSQRMNEYEPEPQEDSWEKIRAGLDLSQQMKEYEPEPQEDSWEKIRAGVELTQKFKNYEVEPQAISWLKIQEAIQSKKRRRGIIIPLFSRIGIAAGLILLLGSIWWLLNTNQSTNMTAAKSDQKKPANSTQPNQKTEPAKTIQKSLPTQESKENQYQEPQKNNIARNIPIAKEKQATSSTIDKLKATNPNKETHIAQNKAASHPTQSKGVFPESINQGTQNINEPVESLTNATPINSTIEDIKLKELTGKPFQPKPIRKLFSAIAYNAEKPYQEKEQRVYRKFTLTASLMPLQTYQAFTILPQTNAYIQQVGRLDAIDNQRLGIQLRAGAMKPLSDRFAMGVSAAYTGVQQWANYEINNGEYEVQTADNGSYTLVGIGEQVAQKQFLQTIGLKLDNAYLVSQKKTKVYAIGGAEAVHVLNNKDFGYYVNASVGIAYPIKGGKSLWVEPTFRYSLSQSFDANNYLKIRPYNIGLNLRINFI